MLYCEECKRVCASDSDCICGNTWLREVQPEDYCYVTEENEGFAQTLEECFANNDMDCVLIPMGNGYRSALGLSLGKFIICVPYKHYDAAQEIVQFFYQGAQDTIKEDLIQNRASWHAGKRTQRKLRKKLKMTDADDFFDRIQDALDNAQSVTDDGLIGSCEFAGHYIAVRGKSYRFWFNSATYEIFI